MRFIREHLLGDESRRYQDYANQLRNLSAPYSPYVSAGTRGLATLVPEYERGLRHPSFLEDELAAAYQPSPYERMEEEHLKRSLANQAAVTGTLGSSYAGKSLAEVLHRLLASDMDKYISRGMGTYQTALRGESTLPGMGLSALGAQDALQQQALEAQLKGRLSRDSATERLFGYGGRLIGGALGSLLNPSTAASSSIPYEGAYKLSPVGNNLSNADHTLYYSQVPFFE